MSGAYDSWNPDADEAIERGHGYSIGGGYNRRSIRLRPKWRATFIYHLRIVLIDMTVILLPFLGAFLLAVTRALWSLIVTALLFLFAATWFRVRRMEHEKRPR